MSYIFTLSGKNSTLTTRIYPPILLEQNGSFVMGLIDFVTYNSIPNVDESNNRFDYWEKGGTLQTIELPEGTYEVEDIEKYINNHIENINKENKKNAIVKDKKDEKPKTTKTTTTTNKEIEENDLVKLKRNNNTQHCEIMWNKMIDFRTNNSIGSVLGFNNDVLKANHKHISHHPINIFKVNAICINCNLITNSYQNNDTVHTLHIFYPTVAPGFKIVEHPNNVIYLPINVNKIDEIIVKIVDQDGQIVNFKEEVITIRLHLKKI